MRKIRIKRKDAVYHVVARSNRGEFILYTSDMKEMFLQVLEAAKRKFDFELKHFCIMSNHVHLMLQPKGNTDLSGLMQWILSVFARRFNLFFKIKGHVWYDRFKSKIIETLQQLIQTFNYISQNPVKAAICNDPRTYPYSGLWYRKFGTRRLLGKMDLVLHMQFPDTGKMLLS